MICQECAKAADDNAAREEVGLEVPPTEHPENCGCPCMHKPMGSWKGKKN
jgi:hypothetical protein